MGDVEGVIALPPKSMKPGLDGAHLVRARELSTEVAVLCGNGCSLSSAERVTKGDAMWRERALQIVLLVVGLFFSAAFLPLIWGLRGPAGSDTGDTMMMSLYLTLGIFLLLAVRRPAEHRSIIAFAAWSSFAHAVTMGTQGLEMPSMRQGFLIGSGVLVVIGVTLLVLAPGKKRLEVAAIRV